MSDHVIRWTIISSIKRGCRGRGVWAGTHIPLLGFEQVEINIIYNPKPYPLVPYYGRFAGLSNEARRFLHEHKLDTLVLRDVSLADAKAKMWAVVGQVFAATSS